MSGRDEHWYRGIESINREYFGFDWETHLRELNEAYLPGAQLEDQLMTVAPGLPPAWFNGNVRQLPDNAWVLVLSHNPHIKARDDSTKRWYDEQHFTPDTWWEHWSHFNLSRRWPKRFVPPLVRLTSGVMEAEPVRRGTKHYAHARMLFAELCPYASERYSLSLQQTRQMIDDGDVGFQLAGDIRRILIEQGCPQFVLVQGQAGIADMATLIDHVEWTRTPPYPSVVGAKEHRHYEGVYSVAGRRIPIFGFSKLGGGYRGTRSHGADIDDLATRMRAFIDVLARE